MAAKRQTPGDIGDDQRQEDHQPDGPRDAKERTCANFIETRVAQLRIAREPGEGLAIRGQHRGSAEHIHGTEGADKRRHIVAGNDPAINGANQRAYQQHQGHNDPHAWKNGDAEHRQDDPFGDKPAGYHSAETERSANRKVDTGSDNDKGDPQRQKGVNRNVFNHNHHAASG